MYGCCRQWEDAVGDNGVLIVYVFSTDLYLRSIFSTKFVRCG